MMFLNKSFNRIIPAYSGNLVLIGSCTGGGKSSMTANLIFSTIKQTNPITGKKRKVLVISCEETAQSCYSRLTCLYKGWNFNNQQDFTSEQKEELINFIPKWAKTGGVTVISEENTGISSLEGIKSVFDNLIKNDIHYDLILIDYIQKINTSRRNSNLKSHEVMREVINYLDVVKNNYPALITVFSQLGSQNEDGTKPFEERLRGCHDLITPCTVAVEIIPNYKSNTSQFVIHKNRYNGTTVGHSIFNFFDKGHFLPMTDELKKKAYQIQQENEYKNTLEKVFASKEKDNEKQDSQ
jgi:hypothetical protein